MVSTIMVIKEISFKFVLKLVFPKKYSLHIKKPHYGILESFCFFIRIGPVLHVSFDFLDYVAITFLVNI